MTTPAHIPTSLALLVLMCIELAVAITELGMFAFLQWAIDQGEVGAFANYPVLCGGIDFGLLTTCITMIFIVYFIVTTRKAYNLYHKKVAMVMVTTCLVLWVVTWGLTIQIFSLHGTSMPVKHFGPSGELVNTTWEVLGTNINEGIWDSILALAAVEWLLFSASAVLLFRFHLRQDKKISDSATVGKQRDLLAEHV